MFVHGHDTVDIIIHVRSWTWHCRYHHSCSFMDLPAMLNIWPDAPTKSSPNSTSLESIQPHCNTKSWYSFNELGQHRINKTTPKFPIECNKHNLFIFSEVIYYPKQYLQFVVCVQQTLSLNGVVSGTVTVNPSLGHSLPGEFTVGQVHTARLVHAVGQVHTFGQVHSFGRVHTVE